MYLRCRVYWIIYGCLKFIGLVSKGIIKGFRVLALRLGPQTLNPDTGNPEGLGSNVEVHRDKEKDVDT